MNENNTFWNIIKELDWNGNHKKCSKILFEKHKNKELDIQEFYDKYVDLVEKINKETQRRNKIDIDSFEEGVLYGSDDCHFIDLPGELIGQGKKEVNKYLSGNYLVPYAARECFSYMFDPLISKKIIKERT